jgi:ribosome maturation factor RimP
MAPSPSAERLARLLSPAVAGAGLVVESVHLSTVGRRRLVRVVVDLPDDEIGAADLDRVAEGSRLVGQFLDGLTGADEAEFLGAGAYALEVTTPGVDRPLTERRHWLRARTRLVRVPLVGGGEAAGRLVDVGDAGIVLESGPDRREIAWADLGKGRIEVEFRKVTDLDEDDPDDGDETEPDA